MGSMRKRPRLIIGAGVLTLRHQHLLDQLAGFAVMSKRSGAEPKYRIGQHVVSVNVASDSPNNAGVSRDTILRLVTTHSTVPFRVSVRMRDPTASSPSRRK
jgi:hypothetical protein